MRVRVRVWVRVRVLMLTHPGCRCGWVRVRVLMLVPACTGVPLVRGPLPSLLCRYCGPTVPDTPGVQVRVLILACAGVHPPRLPCSCRRCVGTSRTRWQWTGGRSG